MTTTTKMRFAGSRIFEIKGIRNEYREENFSIETKIDITGLEKIKERKDTLKADYLFKIDYQSLGNISIKGCIFLSTDTKTTKKLEKTWKEKKFDSPEQMILTNMIIQKASIKALQIEEDLNLPPHIRLPALQPKQNQ